MNGVRFDELAGCRKVLAVCCRIPFSILKPLLPSKQTFHWKEHQTIAVLVVLVLETNWYTRGSYASTSLAYDSPAQPTADIPVASRYLNQST